MTTSVKNSRRFFATRFAERKFVTFLLFASCATALRAQSVQIKVLNGKTGRPVAGACVGVWMMKDPRTGAAFPTDGNGIARLRLTQKDNEIDISYNPQLGCGGNGAINPVLKYGDTLAAYSSGDNPSCAFAQSMSKARFKEIEFSTNEVVQHGVVSANTCGKVTASPQPGEVILFVRPRTFWERVRDWADSEAFPF